MKQYIKNNLQPILIGFCIGISFCAILDTVYDIIIKIAIIQYK